jgi:hypothetical protein
MNVDKKVKVSRIYLITWDEGTDEEFEKLGVLCNQVFENPNMSVT